MKSVSGEENLKCGSDRTRLKPIFRLVRKKALGRAIEGDVGRIGLEEGKKPSWRAKLYTAFLKEEEGLRCDLSWSDGSLIKNLKSFLMEKGVTQGYIKCSEGSLRNTLCGFFMTKNKPIPTFARALFEGESKVLSISGVFIETENEGEGAEPNIVPHLHTIIEKDGGLLGGHLMDAESGELKLLIKPLTGAKLRREVDPATGVMHLRSDVAKEKPERGESLLFAFAPGEDFPNEIRQNLLKSGIQNLRVEFAIGTLWKAVLERNGEEFTVKPRHGLEVLSTSGEIKCRNSEFSHNIHVDLIDRYGRFYRGRIVKGVIKDLIEGVASIEK